MIVPLEEQFARQIDESKKELDSTDEDITLRDFLKIFVNLYGTSKWSPSTFSSKVGTIENYINPLIGDWKLNEIYSEIIDEDRRYNAQKMDEQFYSTLNHDSEMQPQNEEVQPENNGLSDSDMELLSLLKSLTPEMKEMLLKQSASK